MSSNEAFQASGGGGDGDQDSTQDDSGSSGGSDYDQWLDRLRNRGRDGDGGGGGGSGDSSDSSQVSSRSQPSGGSDDPFGTPGDADETFSPGDTPDRDDSDSGGGGGGGGGGSSDPGRQTGGPGAPFEPSGGGRGQDTSGDSGSTDSALSGGGVGGDVGNEVVVSQSPAAENEISEQQLSEIQSRFGEDVSAEDLRVDDDELMFSQSFRQERGEARQESVSNIPGAAGGQEAFAQERDLDSDRRQAREASVENIAGSPESDMFAQTRDTRSTRRQAFGESLDNLPGAGEGEETFAQDRGESEPSIDLSSGESRLSFPGLTDEGQRRSGRTGEQADVARGQQQTGAAAAFAATPVGVTVASLLGQREAAGRGSQSDTDVFVSNLDTQRQDTEQSIETIFGFGEDVREFQSETTPLRDFASESREETGAPAPGPEAAESFRETAFEFTGVDTSGVPSAYSDVRQTALSGIQGARTAVFSSPETAAAATAFAAAEPTPVGEAILFGGLAAGGAGAAAATQDPNEIPSSPFLQGEEVGVGEQQPDELEVTEPSVEEIEATEPSVQEVGIPEDQTQAELGVPDSQQDLGVIQAQQLLQRGEFRERDEQGSQSATDEIQDALERFEQAERGEFDEPETGRQQTDLFDVGDFTVPEDFSSAVSTGEVSQTAEEAQQPELQPDAAGETAVSPGQTPSPAVVPAFGQAQERDVSQDVPQDVTPDVAQDVAQDVNVDVSPALNVGLDLGLSLNSALDVPTAETPAFDTPTQTGDVTQDAPAFEFGGPSPRGRRPRLRDDFGSGSNGDDEEEFDVATGIELVDFIDPLSGDVLETAEEN